MASPIEIGRARRPMECVLTDGERQARSNQVHGELEMREKVLAEQARLEAEAKSHREQAKAQEEHIRQLDLVIRDLSQAARTGRETRPVDVITLYDPTTGEVSERREDTGEVMPLGRKPTAQEWDAITEATQAPLTSDDGTPFTEPAQRRPRDVPGINRTIVVTEAGDPLTFSILGEHIGREDQGTVRDASDVYVSGIVLALSERGDRPISLTPSEKNALREGLLRGLEGPGPLTEQVQANIAAIEAAKKSRKKKKEETNA